MFNPIPARFFSFSRLGFSLPRPVRFFPLLAFSMAVWLVAPGESAAIDRRKDQYPTDQGYMFVPVPYALPGLGSGVAATVAGANMFHTTTDIYGVVLFGEISGAVLGMEELPLVPNFLYFHLLYQSINRAAINLYNTRGMDSDADSYYLVEISDVETVQPILCLCLFQRRLSLTAASFTQKVTVDRFLEPDGTPLPATGEAQKFDSSGTFLGLEIDYTDDYKDPRKGVRLNMLQLSSPNDDLEAPDYTVLDTSLSLYIPFGKISTLGLNFYRSDANVTRQGQTDANVLAQAFGCPSYAACPPEVQAQVDNTLAGNLYGTASALGGNRLRSFPGGRFQGAHVAYFAAEFRWNISEEATPFDYFVWKDVRTNLQLAFFYETGSVSETRETLGDLTRSSYGVGFRMVTASGFVYRADMAFGDEGAAPTIIFGYPFY